MNLVVVITLATATIGALASFVSALVHYLNRRDARTRYGTGRGSPPSQTNDHPTSNTTSSGTGSGTRAA